MDDKTIINIISKTYFTIVSFFTFISLLLFIIFIVLQNGIFFKEINFSTVSINQLYIKWDEKVKISIHDINISDSDQNDSLVIQPDTIQNYLRAISHTTEWFKSITVQNLTYKDFKASFHFKQGEDSFFIAHSKDINISSSIYLEENIVHLKLNHLYDKLRDITAKGSLYFDANETAIYSDINISIAKEADLTLFTKVGTEELFYKIKSHKALKSFKHIIELANLPKEVKYWAYDAIDASSISLDEFYGFVQFNNLNEALKNLHVKVDLKNLNYTYHPELDAIHTEHTELSFKNGILYIYPKEAYSYGHYLGKSWIKVDFTKKEELLTLKLLFDAMLDKNILNILKTYEIKLPFLQKSGDVATDLTIKVGLRTIDIDARGTFTTKKANFDYIGLNIDIFDAIIKLDNYDVSIKNMYAEYKDIVKANVDVTYNAKQAKGEIFFKVKDVNLSGVTNVKTNPLNLSYKINPLGDSIEVAPSKWNFKKQIISVEKTILPFNLNNFMLSIPTVAVEIQNIGTLFLSGSLNVKNLYTDIDIDILKFSYDGVETTQSNTPLNLKYIDNKMILTSKEKIYFSVAGSPYVVNDFFASLEDEILSLKHIELEIGKYITTKIYAKYNLKTKKSHVSLSKFILKDPNTDKTLYSRKKILIGIHIIDDHIRINSKEINAEFISLSTGWRLKISSLASIVKNSILLQKFQISKGDFTLYKNTNDKYTRFKANIEYPYKILVSKNIPMDKYNIKGKIYKEKVYVTLNDSVNIVVKDKIDIDLNHSVINILEIVRLLKELETDSSSDKTLDITLKAKSSSIYVDDKRKILYDNINLQFKDKTLISQLKYKEGEMGFQLEDKNIHVYGKNFNDEFMNALFSLSKFNDGYLDFSVDGDVEKYSGVFYINDTNVKEYKMINNILAFVNTVPSLVTFTIPGYSNNGLLIDKAYLKFSSANNLFYLTDIYLNSKEINIVGKGIANLNNNTLDITLNLKTDLGSSVSKVPLVGYVLMDGDNISTNLSIKGDMAEPTIKSLVAKDIIVAPVNIIKRTLSLPYKLIKDALDTNLSK